ncbi:acyl-CoA dehydrogenase family protein [Thalassobaculum sp. OXR-137]|uniref:acyl-CoA dehydrogenase family protein n=1 Tax=Thalassobaculum sp. OXR-137 TaxID=3100173 RepID=UPI002AC916CB|nr:acyl-CoA dehydrogenase family protein [Thalassobaculum sp. OXR-137]WPZ33507.1 acyl-CoA dehydrogenase family protein [Thalassobaculum sp. OXR-137]
MSFTFTDDQRQLADSIARFLADKYGFEQRNKIRKGDGGWSREIWAEFAALGWLALPIAEEHGGLGGTTVDLALMMEQFGKALVVEPFVATIVLGAEIVAKADPARAAEILPQVAAGEHLLAFAHSEPNSRYDLPRVSTMATQGDEGWILDGHKAVVLHGDSADTLIVSARTGGRDDERDGITLFLVPGDAEGLTKKTYPTIDGMRGADLEFDGVRVGPDAVLGEMGHALDIVEGVADRACVALAAEGVGAMQATVDLTTDYLKTRTQFGKPLGSFQVLQHRAVDMLSETRFAHALCYRTAGLMDTVGGVERARAASIIKAEIGRAGKMVGEEAVQLHGGMGMTDEMAVGHYFKRLRLIDVTFGNAGHHLSRIVGMA